MLHRNQVHVSCIRIRRDLSQHAYLAYKTGMTRTSWLAQDESYRSSETSHSLFLEVVTVTYLPSGCTRIRTRKFKNFSAYYDWLNALLRGMWFPEEEYCASWQLGLDLEYQVLLEQKDPLCGVKTPRDFLTTTDSRNLLTVLTGPMPDRDWDLILSNELG